MTDMNEEKTTTKQSKKNKKKKVLLALVVISILCAIILPSIITKTSVQKTTIISANRVLEKYGLSVDKVSLTTGSKDGYRAVYYIDDFGTLTSDEMIAVSRGLDSFTFDLSNGGYKMVFLDYIVSDYDKYEINPSFRSIEKNGETIYDDYDNSSAKKQADNTVTTTKKATAQGGDGKCDICGKTATFVWGTEEFCKDHEEDAKEWYEKQLEDQLN